MQEFSVFDAKNKLSALLDRIERDDEVATTRRGKVVAKLVRAAPSSRAQPAAERLCAGRSPRSAPRSLGRS